MKYKKGYKYQLVEDLVLPSDILPPNNQDIHTYYVSLLKNGDWVFKRGWAWDGVSGPMMDTKATFPGGCGHDGGAYLLRQGKLPPEYKEPVDLWLPNLFLEYGMWEFRAKYAWKAVSLVDSFADPESAKKIHEVPTPYRPYVQRFRR